MKPLTQRVLERLNYEKLLITPALQARKLRITLEEMLEAAREEPRIHAVIPALVLLKPAALYRLAKDLERHPEVRDFTEGLFQGKGRLKKFFGLEARDCEKAAENYRRFLLHKQSKTKFKTFTFRLADEDASRLKRVSEKMGKNNLSETIRSLVAEKLQELSEAMR